MECVTVYNSKTLDAVAMVTQLTSMEWTLRHYDVGSFELHLPFSAQNAEALTVGAVITHGSKSGIIRYIKAEEGIGGTELTVMGHTLQGLCSDRIIVPPFYYMTGTIDPLYSYDRIKGNGESVIKHYVTMHVTEATDEDRRIARFTIDENLGRGLASVAWQAKFTPLSDELSAIGRFVGLGWGVWLDEENKKYRFDVVPGLDRTVNQSDLPPVIFSRAYKSLQSGSYTYDGLSGVNTVYTRGNGEEEEQFVDKIANGTGIDRREGTTAVSSDDVTEVRDGGTAFLKENAAKETIEAEDSGRFTYRTDWSLGDYVTVRVAMPGEVLTLDKQITEVREVYNRGGTKIEPVFGEKKESLIKKMKKEWYK